MMNNNSNNNNNSSSSSSKNNADNESVSFRARGLTVDIVTSTNNKTAPTENSLTNVMNWVDASETQDSLESLHLGNALNSGIGDEGVEAGSAPETRRPRPLADNGFAPEERRDDEVPEAGVVLETPRVRPLADIANGFSPEEQREERTARGSSKVQTVGEEPKICGGDTISNYFGDTMTLAFAWEGSGSYQGKRLGLTCAHLIEAKHFHPSQTSCHPQGRNIYLRTSNTKDKHGRSSKELIGEVLNHDTDTDSMIFEFHDEVKVKLNKIRVNPRSEIDIKISDVLLETSRFAENVPVLAFGAQTQGAIGRVNDAHPRVNRSVRKAKINPICHGVWSTKENERPGSKLISNGRDCGMIYINDQGIPIGMHHGASEWRQAGVKTYISWVLPLDEIIRTNSDFFGPDLLLDDANRLTFTQSRNLYDTYRGEDVPVIEVVFGDDEEQEDFVEIILPNSLHLSDFTPDNVEV